MLSLFGRPGTLSIQTSRQAARNHSYRCRIFFNKLQPFVFFASYYAEQIILYFCSVEK
jgi:hypothetical protein